MSATYIQNLLEIIGENGIIIFLRIYYFSNKNILKIYVSTISCLRIKKPRKNGLEFLIKNVSVNTAKIIGINA